MLIVSISQKFGMHTAATRLCCGPAIRNRNKVFFHLCFTRRH